MFGHVGSRHQMPSREMPGAPTYLILYCRHYLAATRSLTLAAERKRTIMTSRWRMTIALLAIFFLGCQFSEPEVTDAADAEVKSAAAEAPTTLEEALTLAKTSSKPVLIIGTAHG